MVNFIKRDKDDIYAKPILGFLFKNQKFLLTLRIVVSMLFFYAIYLGFVNSTKENTFTTALFWGIFWSLFMVMTLPTFGRIFCGICPHGFIGKYISKIGLKKTMPKWMQNRYIGIFLLVVGWWLVYYMFPNLFRTPLGTAIMFSVMSIVAFIIYFIYKDMSYCKYICPIGTLTRAYSKLSFTWLGTYKSACNECRTFECATACPYNLKPFTFDNRNSMTDCTLCMDCSLACEAISFKVKKPSFSLFSKFQVLKEEVWAYILIFASIPITMSFHHGIGRSNAADKMIWSKTAEYFKNYIDFGNIDVVGLFAFLYALIITVSSALIGMYVASKILKKDFKSVFYSLGYSYAPLFILGSIAHSLEMFFTRGYKHIVEGFGYGFGFSVEVASLAKRGDGWLHIFGLLKWVAVIWSIIILYKRLKLIDATKYRKIFASIFAASLIILFIGVNMFSGYIFSKYGASSRGHSGHGRGAMFQSVSKDKATILQTGKRATSCSSCGMNLPRTYKTNHAAKDGDKIKQYCSIHCLAKEININKVDLKELKVVDVKSLKFINATDAFYVVGSKKKGTMTRISKYAFASKADAINFVKKNKGKVVDFKTALQIATKDFNALAKDMIKIASSKDTVYLVDENPMANKNSHSGGSHSHGGGWGSVPTKKLWPTFVDADDNVKCLKDITAELYLLDANLTTTSLKQSKDRGCKTISYKMPENGYYNLFYKDIYLEDEILYVNSAKYENLRFNHSNDVIYDEEIMSAHSIKEIPFDILRLREEGETFYHRLYSGDKIRFKIILDNKPLKGAKVTFKTASGWSKTINSDENGIATFTMIKDYFPQWNKFNHRYKNKFSIQAEYQEDKNSTYAGMKYQKVKYTMTYPSVYYPGESGYKSYTYGLLALFVTMLISGFSIYWYRKRRQIPFKEVKFHEKN